MGFRRLAPILPLLVSALVVIGFAATVVTAPAISGSGGGPVVRARAATGARAGAGARTAFRGTAFLVGPGTGADPLGSAVPLARPIPPAGTIALARKIRFGHVSLRIPAAWPVISLTASPRTCPRLNRHALYLGTPGPDPSCPAEVLAGKTESVQVMAINPASPDVRAASRHTVVGGLPALTNPDSSVSHTIIDILPAAGVEISLNYGTDLALVHAIQASVRATASRAAGQDMTTIVPAPIPQAAQQGLYQGSGFDTCAAPSAGTMQQWLASPYRAIGIYIGGVNRACAQANLTAGWINAIQKQGWHYFPFYVGLQASCVEAYGDAPIVTSKASAEGTAAANDAVQQARDLGIPSGTPLIYDMEAYGTGCSNQVITFLSAWDARLHAEGYEAGVYESFSNIGDLIHAQGRMVEPDVIHYADWDGQATTSSSYMPSTMWTDHQRLHQYTGGNNLTYGNATLNVDLDELDVNLGGQSAPYPPPSPSPPVPPLPLFRVVIAMNSNGGAEWFARGANGTIRHAYQHPLGTTDWMPTTAVGDSPDNLVSNPAVTADQNGRLTLFALNGVGQVIHAWQHQGAPNDWLWGGVTGSGNPGKLTGDPAATTAPGGVVAVFTETTRGAVMTTRQLGPNDNTAWTQWTSIGGSCESSPVAFTGGGTAQVVCITKAHALAVTAQTAAGGWQPWQTVPGLTGLTGVPAVTSSGATTEVVASTSTGLIEAARQTSLASGWSAIAGPVGEKVSASPTITTWPGGGFAVFAKLPSGHVGYAVQSGGGASGWSGWTALGTTVIGVPAAWVNSFGSPAAAVLDGSRKVAIANYADGAWTPWLDMGEGF
jgi:hypothetical protein